MKNRLHAVADSRVEYHYASYWFRYLCLSLRASHCRNWYVYVNFSSFFVRGLAVINDCMTLSLDARDFVTSVDRVTSTVSGTEWKPESELYQD